MISYNTPLDRDILLHGSKLCFASQFVTYIEIHLLSIWDLRRDEVGHDKWPGGEKGERVREQHGEL